MWPEAVTLPVMNIAPMLSIVTMTGSLTEMYMLHNNWIMNLTSFTATKSATHSALELDKVMLCYDLDHQDTSTLETYSTKSLMLHLVSRSPA